MQPAQKLTLPSLLHVAAKTAFGKDYNPYNIIVKFKGKVHLLLPNDLNRISWIVLRNSRNGQKPVGSEKSLGKFLLAFHALVLKQFRAEITLPAGGDKEILSLVTNGLTPSDPEQSSGSSAVQFDEMMTSILRGSFQISSGIFKQEIPGKLT